MKKHGTFKDEYIRPYPTDADFKTYNIDVPQEIINQKIKNILNFKHFTEQSPFHFEWKHNDKQLARFLTYSLKHTRNYSAITLAQRNAAEKRFDIYIMKPHREEVKGVYGGELVYMERPFYSNLLAIIDRPGVMSFILKNASNNLAMVFNHLFIMRRETKVFDMSFSELKWDVLEKNLIRDFKLLNSEATIRSQGTKPKDIIDFLETIKAPKAKLYLLRNKFGIPNKPEDLDIPTMLELM
ncbi:MAG: hypothetical protein ABFD50_15405 [Smithella sp.]